MDKLYVLRGNNQGEIMEQLFLAGEHNTALAVAKLWLEKGWRPFLYSKTSGGKFKVWMNWRSRAQKKIAA
jgi:hypothetical protein